MRQAYPDQVLDRLNRTKLGRDTAMLGRRPLPPRPVSLVNGLLTWEEQKDTANITHYKIYLSAGVLFEKVPVGQTKLVGFTETKAFLTSFDSRSELESFERTVTGTAAGGGTSPITFDRHTITANTTITAPVLPSSINKLLVVFVTYSTGGWAITWDTATFSIAPTGLSSLAGKKSAIIFADDGAGKWEMVAPPMTGR